jgi:hypothetical protein
VRQSAYLQDLNRALLDVVAEMYESGKVAASQGNLREDLTSRCDCQDAGVGGRGAEFRV